MKILFRFFKLYFHNNSKTIAKFYQFESYLLYKFTNLSERFLNCFNLQAVTFARTKSACDERLATTYLSSSRSTLMDMTWGFILKQWTFWTFPVWLWTPQKRTAGNARAEEEITRQKSGFVVFLEGKGNIFFFSRKSHGLCRRWAVQQSGKTGKQIILQTLLIYKEQNIHIFLIFEIFFRPKSTFCTTWRSFAKSAFRRLKATQKG